MVLARIAHLPMERSFWLMARVHDPRPKGRRGPSNSFPTPKRLRDETEERHVHCMKTALFSRPELVRGPCVHASACLSGSGSHPGYASGCAHSFSPLSLAARILDGSCEGPGVANRAHALVWALGSPSCFLAIVMVLFRSGLTLATSFQYTGCPRIRMAPITSTMTRLLISHLTLARDASVFPVSLLTSVSRVAWESIPAASFVLCFGSSVGCRPSFRRLFLRVVANPPRWCWVTVRWNGRVTKCPLGWEKLRVVRGRVTGVDPVPVSPSGFVGFRATGVGRWKAIEPTRTGSHPPGWNRF